MACSQRLSGLHHFHDVDLDAHALLGVQEREVASVDAINLVVRDAPFPDRDAALAGCASPTLGPLLAGFASPTPRLGPLLAGCASPTPRLAPLLAGCASPTPRLARHRRKHIDFGIVAL